MKTVVLNTRFIPEAPKNFAVHVKGFVTTTKEELSRFVVKSVPKCVELGVRRTVNPWDTREIDTEDILCPDCDKNSNLDKNDTVSDKKLEEIFNKIIKNLDAKDTEGMI